MVPRTHPHVVLHFGFHSDLLENNNALEIAHFLGFVGRRPSKGGAQGPWSAVGLFPPAPSRIRPAAYSFVGLKASLARLEYISPILVASATKSS